LATLHGVVFGILVERAAGLLPTKNSLHRKVNENNMLDRRFAVAPMMDWSESLIVSTG
jgi:hypothetical protein